MISLEQVGAEQVLIYLKGSGAKLQSAMDRAFARIAVRLQAYIVRQKLQGQVLHHRTGTLARSVIQRVERSGTKVMALVQAGGLAPYAGVHEYGGTFQIPEHLSATRAGKQFIVKAHSATYSERSYMRTSLEENVSMYIEEAEKAVKEAA